MATSYPDRTNARGIWKISDITKNIKTEGTWPGSFGDRGVLVGGWHHDDAAVNTIDYVTISTTGNATDFGDQTGRKYGGAGFSDGIRGG